MAGVQRSDTGIGEDDMFVEEGVASANGLPDAEEVDAAELAAETPPESNRFSQLPERVAPEDMTATQDASVGPDPELGRRDLHRDILLWGAG